MSPARQKDLNELSASIPKKSNDDSVFPDRLSQEDAKAISPRGLHKGNELWEGR